MGLREKWAKSFSEGPIVKQLWKLEENGNVALFVSKDVIISGSGGNENQTHDKPVYHVWNGDNWRFCGFNERQAYNAYEREVKKNESVSPSERNP